MKDEMSIEQLPYPEYGCLYLYLGYRELGFILLEPLLHKLLVNAPEYETNEPAYFLCFSLKGSAWFADPFKHPLMAYDEITNDTQKEEGLFQLLQNQLQWSDVEQAFQEVFSGGKALAKDVVCSSNVRFCVKSVEGPPLLYKYSSFSKKRAKDFVLNNSLFLASPGSFNDPYECPFEERKEEMSHIGLSCFSNCGNSIIMFSHYAEEHRGMCLVFDPHYLGSLKNTKNKDLHSSVRRVFYFDSFPVFDEHASPARIATQKHSHWAYENEYRLFAGRPAPSGVYCFDPNALVGVVFGSRMSEKHKQQINKLAKKRTLPLKFWQASKCAGEYRLNIHEVEYDKKSRVWAKVEEE